MGAIIYTTAADVFAVEVWMVGIDVHGEKVNLRAIREDDLLRRVEWMNDGETVRYYSGACAGHAYALADAVRWRRTLEDDRWAMVWAVETKDGRHIGDIDLHGIEGRARTAKLTVLLGDKEFWGRGYGTDTIRALLQYAFAERGLSKVSLRVFNFNGRAIRCYQKCGFLISRDADASWPPLSPGEVHMTVDRERFISLSRERAAA